MYEVNQFQFYNVLNVKTVMNYRLGTSDADTIRAVMVSDEYLAKTFNYQDNDVFIDVGAHIGTWTILMALFNPTFKVYCYEPIPENYRLIQMNIQSNNLLNVKPFNLSVSADSVGKDSISYTDDSTPFGKSHKFIGCLYNPEIDVQGKGLGRTISVNKTCIDDIFKNNNISKCKVLKLDCEGCECKSLKTISPETLNKIDYVIGEFHSRDGLDINGFFSMFQPYFTDISHTIKNTDDNIYFRRFLYKNKRVK